MATEDKPDEKAGTGDKDSLPVTKAVPTQPIVEPVAPVESPTPQGELTAPPAQPQATEKPDSIPEPLAGPSWFERRTILLGWVGLSIGFFSFLAAIIAGFFIYHQWREMNAQTGYMNRAAIQARKDSADSSVATSNQLKVFQGQLTEARRTRELTESQWKAQQRPWIGLSGNVEFTKTPVFLVYGANPGDRTAVRIDISYKIKNFGISPAFRTASQVGVVLADNSLALPQFQMHMACSLSDGNSRAEDKVSFGDTAIFPTGEAPASFEIESGQSIALTNIRRVWIVGCTSYQDGVSNIIHHTKFWIMSFMIPEDAIPTVIERDNIATKFSLPINGWQMVKTEAD